MTAVDTIIAIASTASLITLGILLNHLWEHRTEAERKRVLDGFPEREKLADEYGKLVGYQTQALVNKELIEVRRVGATLVHTEYLTPKEVQDRITQMKADRYDSLLEENEKLRVAIDQLSKQVEVLSWSMTKQDQEAAVGDVRYHISMTTTANKKRRKKK